MSPSDWPNVTFVDRESTTDSVHRASDVPLRTVCAVLLDTSDNVSSLHSKEGYAVEQGFPRVDSAVEQGIPHVDAVVRPGFPTVPIVVEQGLPYEPIWAR